MGKIIDRARERADTANQRRKLRERREILLCAMAAERAEMSELKPISVMGNLNEYQSALMIWVCSVGIVAFITLCAYLIFFK